MTFPTYRTLVATGVLAAATLGAAQASTFQASPTDAPHSQRALLVKFKEGTPEATRVIARGFVGGKSLRKFRLVPGLELVSLPNGNAKSVARMLQSNPAIEYAEPDYLVRPTAIPNDPQFGSLWGLNNANDLDIDAPQAWDAYTGSSSAIVAVIDTGVKLDHPDLSSNIYRNPKEIAGNGIDDDNNGFIDDVNGWDFYDGDNNPTDTHGHGTHVAGTIGAIGNNGVGVTGINWRCKILPLRFLGPDGGFTSDALLALQYAVGIGAKVSNNSYGGGGYSQAFADGIIAAQASNHLFVAASGNSSQDTDVNPFYPAAYKLPNVLSVSAMDAAGNRASFSNFGATSVHLFAPGTNILSTTPSGYGWSSGTSMASPHVAGVATLLYGRNPALTYGRARDALLTSTRALPSLSGLATHGLLNARAALVAINSAPLVSISSPTNGSVFNTGASISFSGRAVDTEDGGISYKLVWTSNIQGPIGTGASFSRADLAPGNHVITASATDSSGATSTVTTSIVVGGVLNAPPTVSISSPSTGTTFVQSSPISFNGQATDKEDGNLGHAVVWTSNLQGYLSTGPSFSRSDLVVGNHTVTATVTDSSGAAATATTTFTVNPAPSGAPSAPTNFQAWVSASRTVRMQWTDTSNIELGFEVHRERLVGNGWTSSGVFRVGANVTTFTDGVNLQTYRWRVRAHNNAGFSNWSDYVTITVSR